MSTRANMLLERVRWGVSMSALEIQNQDKNEGSTPQVTNFHKLKEEEAMKPTMNMTTIRLSVSKGFSAGTLWRVARVVAAGALLAAGTALYFNMAFGSQAGSPSSIEKMEVAPKFTDLDAVDNYLSVDDLRKYVYPEEAGQARDEAASPSSYWVQRDEAEEMTYDELSKNFIGIPSPGTKITHLESQIASLLADAARDPSRNTPQLNREIERLDNKIDVLRLNAMHNQPAARPK